ncbi:hypothetical protein CEE36_10565 [candidate division TA06 bacterium B3_TA06]|uniref:PEGA domain-containing protein n=1 Tax=candidate division TA06 bacterium B3_TA06 TaxID=2012487 RepID=A0A532UVU1_UNCT6|nr:MAG: hypothetical protein CEE36_10565 [candidate division TA06 bacterium B3_TA06]
MVKKLFLAFLAFSLVITFTGCEEFTDWLLEGTTTTGVEGELELADGVEGDLVDANVYLYEDAHFDSSSAESEETDEKDEGTAAEFKLVVDAGEYYLLAWKDVDEDGAVSYGDLVGIYDGKFGADEPEMIEVTEEEMKDVGTIKMYEYEGGGGGGNGGGTGSIQVSSSPSGAAIYLDGTNTAQTTPATLTNVSEGSHNITLTLSGYYDLEKTVNVTKDQTSTVDATLEAKGGVVSVDVDAILFLDGWYINYFYTFNHDVFLTNCVITIPSVDPFIDSDEYGKRSRGQTYTTGNFAYDPNNDGVADGPIPTGTHILLFEGYESYSEQEFSIEKEISVPLRRM